MYAKNLSGCCGGRTRGLGFWEELGTVAVQTASSFAQNSGGDSGSDHCWTRYDNHPFSDPCPGTPNYDAIARAVERAPALDIAKLVRYLLESNAGSGPKGRADLLRLKCLPFWVKAIMGGKGCVASKFPEAPAFLISLVEKYGAPANEVEAQPGSSWIPGTPGLGVAAEGERSSLLPLVAAGLSVWFVPKLLGK